MKLSTTAHYSRGYIGMVDEIKDLEKAGIDTLWFAESYSFDSVSAMGFFAGLTERVTIASGILNTYSRTPTALAMTAAGLDALSKGRFMLGLGASGPQVIEGFHGVPYQAPLARMRDVIEICRKVWRREEKLTHAGPTYHIPLPENQGTGLGKPLKIINHPVRSKIPIALATLGAKSVEMTAEIADAWLPAFFMPEGASNIWGDALKRGRERRDPKLAPLQVYAGAAVAIGEGIEAQRELTRSHTALYVGGMGAKEQNFYNQIFRQYGYAIEAEEIQQLYLAGQKSAAAAAIPQRFIDQTSLVGSPAFVKDRLQAYQQAGVTHLHVSFLGSTAAERIQHCDALKNLLEKI